jgi:tetratricopeptide (TPR) repeat protein
MTRHARQVVRKKAGAAPAVFHPPLTANMFQEAVRRHQLGQLAQAEALYRAIIAIHPAPADASYNLGLLLQTDRRYPDAADAYRHAIALRPDYVEALSNLGTVLQELGRLDEAVEIYRQAIAHQPAFAMAYTNLGTALKEQGNSSTRLPLTNSRLSSVRTPIRSLPIWVGSFSSYSDTPMPRLRAARRLH